MDFIETLLWQGNYGIEIEKQIRALGYTGSPTTVRHHIAKWKRERKRAFEAANGIAAQNEILKRSDVFKLLFYPLDKVKRVSSQQFNQLCEQYPAFHTILSIHQEFRTTLKSNDLQKFYSWLDKVSSAEIPELNQFINGINNDFAAVKNAVIYGYSNGLAEGYISKIKLIKRIMYGKASFKTLRSKTLLLF